MVMLLARLGSLNALDGMRPSRRQLAWIGAPLPSADRVGDVAAGIEVDDLRAYSMRFYMNLRRKRGLQPLDNGLRPLVLDAHESFASYRRCCSGCLTRTIKTATGERTQYYHRYVTAELRHRDGCLLLDMEPLHEGEGEIAAAVRLLERLLDTCPQAFDLVCGDALYMDPAIWLLARSRGKHVVTVLKNERRDLLTDARSLFNELQPVVTRGKALESKWWDISSFNTWPQVNESIRVVRSVETTTVRRQLTGQDETITTEWVWATSLPRAAASTAAVVHIGHERWSIENQCFNQLANAWHADHCYKHDPVAIVAFLLLTFIAFNLFHVFLARNVKPELRRKYTMIHFARQIAAQLCAAHGGPL